MRTQPRINWTLYRQLDQSDKQTYLEKRSLLDLSNSEIPGLVGFGYDSLGKSFLQIAARHLNDAQYLHDQQEKFDSNVFLQRALQQGIQAEPNARRRFSTHFKVDIRETGIHPIHHPWLNIGCSPDGLVYQGQCLQGVYETKRPARDVLYHTPKWNHLIQVQGEIQALRVSCGWLHCYIPNSSRVWMIKRDDGLWNDLMERVTRLMHLIFWIRQNIDDPSDQIEKMHEMAKKIQTKKKLNEEIQKRLSQTIVTVYTFQNE
jgi:uncharacterized protein (UPF0305 family)